MKAHPFGKGNDTYLLFHKDGIVRGVGSTGVGKAVSLTPSAESLTRVQNRFPFTLTWNLGLPIAGYTDHGRYAVEWVVVPGDEMRVGRTFYPDKAGLVKGRVRMAGCVRSANGGRKINPQGSRGDANVSIIEKVGGVSAQFESPTATKPPSDRPWIGGQAEELFNISIPQIPTTQILPGGDPEYDPVSQIVQAIAVGVNDVLKKAGVDVSPVNVVQMLAGTFAANLLANVGHFAFDSLLSQAPALLSKLGIGAVLIGLSIAGPKIGIGTIPMRNSLMQIGSNFALEFLRTMSNPITMSNFTSSAYNFFGQLAQGNFGAAFGNVFTGAQSIADQFAAGIMNLQRGQLGPPLPGPSLLPPGSGALVSPPPGQVLGYRGATLEDDIIADRRKVF